MDKFDVIILTGRPAAGKSEVIDFLKHVGLKERLEKFHIADFEEIDDFIYVWETFENDDIWESLGKPRQNTTKDYYFLDEEIWNFYIKKINLEFSKRIARNPDLLSNKTEIIEFARGGENGIKTALENLSDEILKKAGIVYIKVSYEESQRKNRRRFRPGLKDSILYHSLPDEKMEFYYKINDWEKLSGGKNTGFINVRGINVPFSVFENEPEKTDSPEKLSPALKEVFDNLLKIYKK